MDPQPTRKTPARKPDAPAISPVDTQPVTTKRAARKSSFPWRWVLTILGIIVLIVVVGAFTGYRSGLRYRQANQAQLMEASLVEQMDLGIQDLLAGRYELASDRFEYILSLDPNYEGAAELLGQALLALDQPTPSPSPEVTLTPTATPDFGSLESTFASAQEAFSREDWTATIDILIVLRGKDPSYRLEDVNRMLATSLRNRGMDKLMQGLLEPGIYDLTLAERFGPLDNQAATWRASAAFFTFANSYYGLNWAKAVEYFGQICASNIWGACGRYARAALEYAAELDKADDWCNAAYYYQDAMDRLGDYSPAETATEVANLCLTATAGTPTPTETLFGTTTITATDTITPGGPTPTPSSTPTITPTTGGPPTNTVTPTLTSTWTATATLTPPP